MNTVGRTVSSISCSTNSLAAEVLTLNPTRFSSRAYVAVPPGWTDAVAAGVLPPLPELELLPPPHAATPSARAAAPTTTLVLRVNRVRMDTLPSCAGFHPAPLNGQARPPTGHAGAHGRKPGQDKGRRWGWTAP